MGTHENGTQTRLFHSDRFLLAAGTDLEVLRASALQTKDMLTGNHPTVDEDRLVALVADVYHRIQDLLADQVHFVIPIQSAKEFNI